LLVVSGLGFCLNHSQWKTCLGRGLGFVCRRSFGASFGRFVVLFLNQMNEFAKERNSIAEDVELYFVDFDCMLVLYESLFVILVDGLG
jgi:hypothetical protein